MSYANFKKTISPQKVFIINNLFLMISHTFFSRIFVCILNTLPVRAKALRHGASIEQNIHTVFHFKTAKSAIKQE